MDDRRVSWSSRAGAVAALFALASCGGPARTADLEPQAGTVRRALLPTADSGLQVRLWRVSEDPEDPGRSLAILTKYAASAPADAVDHERLAQNGFTLVPVATDALPALQREIRTSRDVEGRYGQAYEWRTVTEVMLGDGARTVAIDGRVRSLLGGRLRLVVRGWTLPMEDGPMMYVQAVPEHDRTPSTRLAQALGRRAFVGDRFPGAGLELMMRPGTAWVLTALPPDGATASGNGPDAAEDGDSDDRSERDAPAGPAVETPPTIGAMLLRRDDRSAPGHDLLVFVPRIPDALAPPPLARTDPDTMEQAERDRPRRNGS